MKKEANAPQLMLDFAQVKAEESPADLVLSFSPAEGVLVCGATRQWKDAIKAVAFRGRRFRFSRNLPDDCAWYAPNTRDAVVEQPELERVADALRRAGPTVELRFSAERLAFGERERARAERMAERLERRQERAQRLEQKADQEFAAARAHTERIPLGQPILVGHHSERKHRKAIERQERGMQRGVEAGRAAVREASKARTLELRQKMRSAPGTTKRRIDRLSAELRKVQRNLYGHPGKGTTLRTPPASGAYREKLLQLEANLQEQIAHWQAELGEATQYMKTWGPKDFAPGDGVHGKHGWAVVRRASPKTLTVDYVSPALRPLNPQQMGYEYVEDKLKPDPQRLLKLVTEAPKWDLSVYADSLGWDEGAVTAMRNVLMNYGFVHLDERGKPYATIPLSTVIKGRRSAAPAAPKKKRRLKWTKGGMSAARAKPYVMARFPDQITGQPGKHDALAAFIIAKSGYGRETTYWLQLEHFNEPGRTIYLNPKNTMGGLAPFRKQEEAKDYAEQLLERGEYKIKQ